MLFRRAKTTRGSRRWEGWDDSPLERRQLMSGASPPAYVHAHGTHLGTREAGSATPAIFYLNIPLTIKNHSRFSVRITNVTYDPFDYGHPTPAAFNNVVIAPGHDIRVVLDVYAVRAIKYFELSLNEATTGKEILRTGVDVHDSSADNWYWVTAPWQSRVLFDGVGLEFHAVGRTSVLELKPV